MTPGGLPSQAMRVLVTRPEPGLRETMAAVSALGLTPVACPMLLIEYRPLRSLSAAAQAVILTSGQAVPFLKQALDEGLLRSDALLIAVGDRTASRAREAGFVHVVSASGAAQDLVGTVHRLVPPGAGLLLPTGRGEGQGLAAELRRAGYRISRRVAYVARPARMIAADALADWAADPLAALFFSRASAAAFERARQAMTTTAPFTRATAIALSGAVAGALPAAGWGGIVVADRPEAAAMIAALRALAASGRPA